MTLIGRLKTLYKAAVHSGKIIYLGPKRKFQRDEDFSLFLKQLASIEWKQFEEREFLFRKKAISVVKNNGYWPSRDNFQLTTVLNEQYYDSLDKYTKAEDFVVYTRIMLIDLA